VPKSEFANRDYYDLWLPELSLGCYCEDESRCHRFVLRELLLERGAEIG
jgi:uncharacterized protein YeaO (DUF488 family)